MFSAKDLFFTPPAGGYTIAKSLRFRSSASAYLSRTPSVTSNRTTYTWSGWVKRGTLGAVNLVLFGAGSTTSDIDGLQFLSDAVHFYTGGGNTGFASLITTQVFRDPSAWYHIMVAVDTTQATASNRVKIYVNGAQVTVFSTATYPNQNTTSSINNTVRHAVGSIWFGTSYVNFFDGYLSEVNFIDGQALTPSSFGETNTATGVWMPKAYTGTYGTNGFYLKFADASAATAAAIGKDSSPNGNNWTPNNISVTAGVTYDSMVDTPTNYDNGGNGAGNYAVLNPLYTNGQVASAGNLNVTSANALGGIAATLGMPTGKWYCEFTCVTRSTNVAPVIGYYNELEYIYGTRYLGDSANSGGIRVDNGNAFQNTATTTYTGASGFVANDVMIIAFDADAKKMWFGKNGTWFNSGAPSSGTGQSPLTITGNTFFFAIDAFGDTWSVNFGQRPFTYTPPSGFKALCTQNLPTPTIGATSSTLANKYFDATLYTGNGTSQSIVNSGAFQPDFVWVKLRSATASNILQDAVRGAGKSLVSNTTAAETGLTGDLISSFNSNGFTVNINLNGGSDNSTNFNAGAFVGWQWKANGSGSSNTSGTITSTVSANVTAGFSVVAYTGNGVTSSTVGHGLGVAPKMIIVKWRGGANNWAVGHNNLTNWNWYLQLNGTAAQTGDATVFPVAPTSSVFYVGTNALTNGNTNGYVAYCFAEVAGYSKFGSYTGNGSADGPFVYCGFRPRFVLIKNTSVTGDWYIFDTARSSSGGANVEDYKLYPNTSNAENGLAGETTSTNNIDTLSNGFKMRTTNGNTNGSTNVFIYAAFAESPFNYARAR